MSEYRDAKKIAAEMDQVLREEQTLVEELLSGRKVFIDSAWRRRGEVVKRAVNLSAEAHKVIRETPDLSRRIYDRRETLKGKSEESHDA